MFYNIASFISLNEDANFLLSFSDALLFICRGYCMGAVAALAVGAAVRPA